MVFTPNLGHLPASSIFIRRSWVPPPLLGFSHSEETCRVQRYFLALRRACEGGRLGGPRAGRPGGRGRGRGPAAPWVVPALAEARA